MNNSELKNYRKNFYTKLEEFIKEKESLTLDDLYLILGKCIKECNTTEETSKKILIYIGSYVHKKEDNKEIEHLTYDGNFNAEYKLYKDVETGFIYKSLVKESKKFEKAYKILYPTINIYNIQEYNKQYEKMRLEYYKKLLYGSQKSTYKLMKKNSK